MTPPAALSTTDSSIASLNLSSPSTTGSTLSPINTALSPSAAPTSTNTSAIQTPHEEDDMTEDEVALMVKNALRKARKAMSSPSSDEDSFTSNSLGNSLGVSAAGSGLVTPRTPKDDFDLKESDVSATVSANEDGGSTNEEDLARRIEEEIKGARAFAEKVYYGGSKSKVEVGRMGRGVSDSSLPVEAPSAVYEPSSPVNRGMGSGQQRHSMSSSAAPQGGASLPPNVTNSSSSHQNFNSVNKPEQEQRSFPPPITNTETSPTKQPSPRTTPTTNSSPYQKLQDTTNTPLPSSPLKKELPRQHRQVVFRHPYPLPPPPILPRPDSAIIAENDVRQTALRFKIAEPDSDLLALIHAATDESLVRRSNACGALKVLASKDNNRAKMCRTRGLLEALLTASKDDAVDSDALDARTRAVTTLLYLAEPKDNRLIVARHANMLNVLVKVIQEDTGEARLRACCALATLAKTPQNRGLICGTGGLAGVLSGLMVENAVEKSENASNAMGGAMGSGGMGNGMGGGRSPIQRTQTTESRDDSTHPDDDLSTFSIEDDRHISNTFSGTFSHGTGTFTEGYSDEERSVTDDEGYSSVDSEEESVQEEEGVEMQISSLKKMNIENHSDFLARSQLSACATLTHLTKHCANAPLLAQDEKMLSNIVFIASIFDNPLHTRCIEIICNLTRFPSNNARLAANSKVVDTLLLCGKSKIPEDRLWAIRTIQNLCSDASSKVTLATGAILSMLSTSAMRKDYDEQFAAVGALMNLSTEPGSIVPLTNTKTVVATLVHLAHSPNTHAAVRKIACDSLATIGLWLQTLASAGTVPEEIPFSPLPTHSATGWLRWES